MGDYFEVFYVISRDYRAELIGVPFVSYCLQSYCAAALSSGPKKNTGHGNPVLLYSRLTTAHGCPGRFVHQH
jgi:hypothetical protein